MGKLRVLSGQEACKILITNSFIFAHSGKGSHMVYQKTADSTTYSVPVPMHSELAIGTLLSIIRLSGLPRRLFEVS